MFKSDLKNLAPQSKQLATSTNLIITKRCQNIVEQDVFISRKVSAVTSMALFTYISDEIKKIKKENVTGVQKFARSVLVLP